MMYDEGFKDSMLGFGPKMSLFESDEEYKRGYTEGLMMLNPQQTTEERVSSVQRSSWDGVIPEHLDVNAIYKSAAKGSQIGQFMDDVLAEIAMHGDVSEDDAEDWLMDNDGRVRRWIDTDTEIYIAVEEIENILRKKASKKSSKVAATEVYTCPECNYEFEVSSSMVSDEGYYDGTCRNCGADLSYYDEEFEDKSASKKSSKVAALDVANTEMQLQNAPRGESSEAVYQRISIIKSVADEWLKRSGWGGRDVESKVKQNLNGAESTALSKPSAAQVWCNQAEEELMSYVRWIITTPGFTASKVAAKKTAAFGVQYVINRNGMPGPVKVKDFPTEEARERWIASQEEKYDIEILAYSDSGQGMLASKKQGTAVVIGPERIGIDVQTVPIKATELQVGDVVLDWGANVVTGLFNTGSMGQMGPISNEERGGITVTTLPAMISPAGLLVADSSERGGEGHSSLDHTWYKIVSFTLWDERHASKTAGNVDSMLESLFGSRALQELAQWGLTNDRGKFSITNVQSLASEISQKVRQGSSQYDSALWLLAFADTAIYDSWIYETGSSKLDELDQMLFDLHDVDAGPTFEQDKRMVRQDRVRETDSIWSKYVIDQARQANKTASLNWIRSEYEGGEGYALDAVGANGKTYEIWDSSDAFFGTPGTQWAALVEYPDGQFERMDNEHVTIEQAKAWCEMHESTVANKTALRPVYEPKEANYEDIAIARSEGMKMEDEFQTWYIEEAKAFAEKEGLKWPPSAKAYDKYLGITSSKSAGLMDRIEDVTLYQDNKGIEFHLRIEFPEGLWVIWTDNGDVYEEGFATREQALDWAKLYTDLGYQSRQVYPTDPIESVMLAKTASEDSCEACGRDNGSLYNGNDGAVCADCLKQEKNASKTTSFVEEYERDERCPDCGREVEWLTNSEADEDGEFEIECPVCHWKGIDSEWDGAGDLYSIVEAKKKTALREIHEFQNPPDKDGWEITDVWIEEDGFKAIAYDLYRPEEDRMPKYQVRIFDPRGREVHKSENTSDTLRDWHYEADRLLTAILGRDKENRERESY